MGAAGAVYVMNRGRRGLTNLLPAPVASVLGVGQRRTSSAPGPAEAAGQFVADFRSAMADREAQLRAAVTAQTPVRPEPDDNY